MRDSIRWESGLRDDIRCLLTTAREQFRKEEDFAAMSTYFQVLHRINPDDYVMVYNEIMAVVKKCQLVDMRLSVLLGIPQWLYGFFPDSFETSRLYAIWLFNQERILEAIEQYKRTLTLTTSSHEQIRIQVEMDNTRSHLFDAWHFLMINDGLRNNKFASAIRHEVQRLAESNPTTPIHVMDLGCGTGILTTVIAKEMKKYFSADKYIVSAVDCNPIMVHVAKKVFEKNQVSIELHDQHSSSFKHPVPLNLIVSETLDCAVFGENFVSSLVDLKKRLAPLNDVCVLPAKATVYVAACAFDKIERIHFCEKTNEDGKVLLLSNECGLNWPPEKSFALNDPYDATSLDRVGGEYELLSEPIPAFTLEFNDFEFLEDVILKNLFKVQLKLETTKSGRASCIVSWFNLDLGNDVQISTAPGQNSCWPQTIYPFYPPTQLDIGSVLSVNAYVKDERLYMFPSNIVPEFGKKIRLSRPEDLVFMNSTEIANFFNKSIECLKPSGVIDQTDLVLERKGESYRYLTTRSDLVDLIGNNAFLYQEGNFKVQNNGQVALLHWPFNAIGNLDYPKFETTLHYVQSIPNLLLIPSTFRLKGMLIQSDQLNEKSSLIPEHLRNETYCGVDLSPMQEYSIYNYHEINLDKLPYAPVTDVKTLFEFSFAENFINKEFEMNSVLDNDVQLKVISPDVKPNAIVYWIEVMTQGNGPDFSFRHFYACTSAFIFKSEMDLTGKQDVQLKVSMSGAQFVFNFSD